MIRRSAALAPASPCACSAGNSNAHPLFSSTWMRPDSYLAAVARGPRARSLRPCSDAFANSALSIDDARCLGVAMKSLPFTAKMGKVIQEVGSDRLQLSQAEADIAQQSYLPKIAEQFEP